MANLKQKYQEAVVPALSEKFGFKNPMLVPKVNKVVINMAFGIVNKDTQKSVVDDLTKITARSRLSARRARACRTSSSARAWSSAPR